MTKKESRRDFIKKASYTAPAILTLNAAPAFAKNGSGVVIGKYSPFIIGIVCANSSVDSDYSVSVHPLLWTIRL